MITNECVSLIKRFEGCVLKVYLDPVGIPSSGYGHTAGLTRAMVGTPITQAQADQWLREDLLKFEKKVAKYEPRYHWTPGEWGGLISFCYNVGNIDGLTAKGTRTKQEIADAFLLYTKAKGRVLDGLVKRRKAERELFLSGKEYPVLKRGMQGKAVKDLQMLLGINADGIYGCLTETAVRLYQKQHGLHEDGVCGKDTWAELLK